MEPIKPLPTNYPATSTGAQKTKKAGPAKLREIYNAFVQSEGANAKTHLADLLDQIISSL